MISDHTHNVNGNDLVSASANAGEAVSTHRRHLALELMATRERFMQHFRPVLTQHNVTEQQWRVIRALAANGLFTHCACAIYLSRREKSSASRSAMERVSRGSGKDVMMHSSSQIDTMLQALMLTSELTPIRTKRALLFELLFP